MAYAVKGAEDRRAVGEINRTNATKGTKTTMQSFSSLLSF